MAKIKTMTPKKIKTDERIFEATNFEGETYLCNLEHFSLNEGGSLLGAFGEELIRVRHYWNNSLKKIGKIDVKQMILAQRKNNLTL